MYINNILRYRELRVNATKRGCKNLTKVDYIIFLSKLQQTGNMSNIILTIIESHREREENCEEYLKSWKELGSKMNLGVEYRNLVIGLS